MLSRFHGVRTKPRALPCLRSPPVHLKVNNVRDWVSSDRRQIGGSTVSGQQHKGGYFRQVLTRPYVNTTCVGQKAKWPKPQARWETHQKFELEYLTAETIIDLLGGLAACRIEQFKIIPPVKCHSSSEITEVIIQLSLTLVSGKTGQTRGNCYINRQPWNLLIFSYNRDQTLAGRFG